VSPHSDYCRKATPLFDDIEEQLDYMEETDLDVAKATLLESLGRFAEAAEIHFAEGLLLFVGTDAHAH
jgi:hypothetical protein